VTALELLVCGALIGCSAFLSSAEVSLFSLSRFQLRSIRDRFKKAHKTIKKLQSDPGGVLVTILVLNEIVNISLSTVLTGVIDRMMPGESWSWVVRTLAGIAVTMPLLLFFCEVTPKTIGVRGNTLIAPLTSQPLFALYTFMAPIRRTVNGLIRFVARRKSSQSPLSDEAPLKEEDFLVMAEEGQREGAIHRSELELIRNVFSLDDTEVRELMTPLAQFPTLQETLTIEQAIEQIRIHKSPRVPVLTRDKKRVVGILYLKDLLRARLNPALGHAPLSELIVPPIVVSSELRVNRLFKKLRQSKTHIAIIEDHNHEAVGVLTLDQILDELLEELVLTPPAAGGSIR
jgi:putative hemolysin